MVSSERMAALEANVQKLKVASNHHATQYTRLWFAVILLALFCAFTLAYVARG